MKSIKLICLHFVSIFLLLSIFIVMIFIVMIFTQKSSSWIKIFYALIIILHIYILTLILRIISFFYNYILLLLYSSHRFNFKFTINQCNAKTMYMWKRNTCIFNLNNKKYIYLPGEVMYSIQPNKLKTSRPTAKLNSNSYEID